MNFLIFFHTINKDMETAIIHGNMYEKFTPDFFCGEASRITVLSPANSESARKS